MTLPGRTLRRAWTAVGFPLLFVLVWSSGFLVGSIGVRDESPVTIAFWRFLLAAVVLGAVAVASGAPWPSRPMAWVHLVVSGVLLQAVQFLGAFYAMKLGVSAGLTSLVTDSTPLTVALLSLLVFREYLNLWQVTGLALGFAGVVVAVLPDVGGIGAGLVAAVLGMLGFAAGTLYQKAVGNAVDMRTAISVQLAGATVVMIPVAAATDGFALEPTLTSVLTVTWLAVVGSIGAFLLLFLLLRSRPGASATSYLFLVPPTTALLGVPLLGQPLQVASVAGIVLAAVGVRCVTRGSENRRRTEAAASRTG